METKKTPKANLESRKPTWLLVGYIVVLAFMFIAIEWTRDIKIDTSGGIADDIFELDIEMPITRQPELAPPPPPQVTPINDVLTIVDDASSVEETTIQTTEDFGEAVDIKYVPVVTEEDVPAEDEIFEVVEEKPDFADGGMLGLMRYLRDNLKYPAVAIEAGTEGRVAVQFVVNKDGSIVDVKVAKGIDPYLDKEAIRVISSMPKWKPGKQRGVPVRCKFTVPVTFKLQ